MCCAVLLSHLCTRTHCREEEVIARSPKSAKASSARGSSTSLAAATGGGSADGGPAAAAAEGSTTPKAGAAGAAGETGGGDALSRKRAFKEKWQEGVALFNKKPKKGIAMLQVGAAPRASCRHPA